MADPTEKAVEPQAARGSVSTPSAQRGETRFADSDGAPEGNAAAAGSSDVLLTGGLGTQICRFESYQARQMTALVVRLHARKVVRQPR